MDSKSLKTLAIVALAFQAAAFLYVLLNYPFFLMGGLMGLAGGGHGGGSCSRSVATFVSCVAIVGLLLVPLVQVASIAFAGAALRRGSAKSTLVFSLVPVGWVAVLMGSWLLVAT